MVERGSLLNNRYQILEILGQGGMGSIYRAVDENLGVEVAVKENLFTTDEYARQFRREAVILANLRHANLPRVTDHFVIEGQGQYLVMDFIEGEDLRERIDREGLLSDADAVILGTTVCEALTYLHTRQPKVVHRDIKPGNVKITPAGNITLVDFGLAKVYTGGQATTTGARAMTPGYSPPEQYGTASTDHRSDIFSLGATLYMALTGALPEDALARAMGQAELTPIRKYNPRVSRRLVAVIDKAMALRPEDRYQSAEDFKQALIKSRVITGKRAATELTLTPAPAMAMADQNVAYGNEPAQIERANPPDQIQMATSGSSLLPTGFERSPNAPLLPERPRRKRLGGCWLSGILFLSFLTIAAIGISWYRPALATQAFDQVAEMVARLPISIPSNLEPSAIATNGEQDSTSLVVDVNNHTSTPTSETSTVQTILATATPTLRPTLTPSPTETLTPTPAATPLGGGRGQIIYASDISGLPQIWLISADRSINRQITYMPDGACQPAWSPDGESLAFISPCASNQEIYPGARIYIMNVDDSEPIGLPTAPGGDFDPAWSPDGNKIAFTSIRDFNRAQVYVYDFEDDSVVSLSANTVRDNQPAWSPDGDQIAFITTRRGPYQIWIMDAQGGEPFLLSRSGSLKNSHPDWSPDGISILFTQHEILGGVPRLVVIPVEQGNFLESRLIQEVIPMREASYSPDGNWIAFESWPEGNQHDIYIMTSTGLARQNIIPEDIQAFNFDPTWRP
jgi:eukaryotic-like serine/threonine-protein kinase